MRQASFASVSRVLEASRSNRSVRAAVTGIAVVVTLSRCNGVIGNSEHPTHVLDAAVVSESGVREGGDASFGEAGDGTDSGDGALASEEDVFAGDADDGDSGDGADGEISVDAGADEPADADAAEPDACDDAAAARMSDDLNCGSCGHDCLHPGACVSGVCEAFQLAVSNDYWGNIFVDDHAVYTDVYAEAGTFGGNVVAYDKQTGAIVGESTDLEAGAIELQDANFIYTWAGGVLADSAILDLIVAYPKSSLLTFSARGIRVASGRLAAQFGSTGTAFFYTADGIIESTPLPPAGPGGPRVAGTVLAADAAGIVWQGTGDDGGSVLYASGGDFSNVTPLATPDNLKADHAVLSADSVYYSNAADGTVYVSSRDGRNSRRIASISDSNPGQLAVDDRYVYIADPSAQEIDAVPLDGGSPIRIAQGSGVGTSVAVDSTAVYWTSATQLTKRAK